MTILELKAVLALHGACHHSRRRDHLLHHWRRDEAAGRRTDHQTSLYDRCPTHLQPV